MAATPFDWDAEIQQYRSLAKPPSTPHRPVLSVPQKAKEDCPTEDGEGTQDVWVEYKSATGEHLWVHRVTFEMKREEKRETADSPTLSAEGILRQLKMISSQVETILEQSHSLSSLVCEDLREIKDKVNSVHTQIQQGGSLDDRGDVEALVELNRLPWKFTNPHTAQYRREAYDINYDGCQYEDWHLPQYLSRTPLPPHETILLIHVNLPKIQKVEKTRVPMTAKDPVSKAVRLAYSKMRQVDGLGVESDYVLKAEGLKDYMVGENRLFDYEHVRRAIREGMDVRLSLVKRPAPEDWSPDSDLVAEYESKIDPELTPITPSTHRGISALSVPWQEVTAIPMSELHVPLKMKILGLDNLVKSSLPRLEQVEDGLPQIYLKVTLFHGVEKLPLAHFQTKPEPLRPNIRVMKWFPLLTVSSLPRESRIGFELWACTSDGEHALLGWVVRQMVDERGVMVTGRRELAMWPTKYQKKKHAHSKKRGDSNTDFIYRATTRDNQSDASPCMLQVQFDEFETPVVAPLTERARAPDPRVVGAHLAIKSLHRTKQARLEALRNADTLYKLNIEDKDLLWSIRQGLVKEWKMLPKFLQSVNWGIPDHKFEAHRLLKQWAQPARPELALELLDAKYPDYTVRQYAVSTLRRLDDDLIKLYLLQLVQCLKFEPYHNNPLKRFLVERSLRSPLAVGHHFFWHLKAELHDPMFCERFALILEEYLTHAGRYANELRKQNGAVLKLQKVAEMIVKMRRKQASDEDIMAAYHQELRRLNEDFFKPMGKFKIPFNPKLEAKSLIIPKCRYMSSKMVPLWLVFTNADEDGPPIYIMFKSGDDLRQDILTLQLLKVMDKMWLSAGYDMKLKPYEVIATGVNDQGKGVGMIELVMDSDTTSGIQLKYGGASTGALRLDPIVRFLKHHNEGKVYEKAVENFIASCAGYCVATYILGIGDRHNGNIMVTKDGHLFHIDFGHFLGNFKKKFGVNRERAAFVFTPEMAYVIGGRKYKDSAKFKHFQSICTCAYKTLRENANFLETLFTLMVGAGMPELMSEQDINYLRDKLYLDATWKKADKQLHEEIFKSLDNLYRRIDNLFHIWRHGN